jgi:type IV pilus assembly protein PilN
MIEINLLPGPKKKRRAGPGLGMPDVSELMSSVKDPLLIGAVASLAIAALIIGLVWVTETQKISALEPELRQARNDARQFTLMIAEKRNMEGLRDSLVSELRAIREIDADRYVWPHILEEVTRALPAFTWLVTLDNVASAPAVDVEGEPVAKPPVKFSIEGRTSDIQAYTRFVRQLGESPWLADIVLGPTQTVMEEERSVTSFQIQGTYHPADSAYIRTQPVTEAAR